MKSIPDEALRVTLGGLQSLDEAGHYESLGKLWFHL